MLTSFSKIVGKALLLTMVFCASLMMSISFFDVKDSYSRVLVAKALSLLGLAVWGRSEALRAYLKYHGTEKAKVINWLDQFGAFLAISAAFLLVWKIVTIEAALGMSTRSEAQASIAAYTINVLQANSEIVSITPLFLFALVNVCIWLAQKDGIELGRVSFVLSNLPVLIPILVALLLTSVFGGGYGTKDFKLLFGGATVMLILVSIILNCCVESLIESHDAAVPPGDAANSRVKES